MNAVTFGEWLKQRRKQLDLTQEALAGQVGCSIAAIKKIEAGDRRPSRQIAELLAEHLQLPTAQRATFIRVARGELPLERLSPPPVEAATPGGDGYPLPLSGPRTNIPLPQSALIGRENEQATIARLLADPQCRLVTLSGVGGVGKTRLALKAAEAHQESFRHGVFAVLLAPLNRNEQILPTLAEAIGFTFYGSGDPGAQLLSYLRDKQMLLVFDNCEHLLTSAEGASELLRLAPRLKILATSRERLNLPEEWVLALTGLSLPADSASPDSASVRLFVQAAGHVKVGFTLTEADRPHVIRICQWVDGLPLGIELAAAWVRTLACREIAEEIERGLDILAAPRRGVAERHQSLRAVFEYSWQLLTEAERAVFKRLGVFPGSFSREAGEAIAGASLSALAALVDKSLLQPHDGRYDLHPAVRQFAMEKLEADPATQAETLARHSAFYGDFAFVRRSALRGRDQKQALEEIAVELDNLRAGSRWAFRHGAAEEAARYLDGPSTYFEIQSRSREGRAVAIRRLETWEARKLDSVEAAILRARLLAWIGAFNSRMGQGPEADAALREALTILRGLGDHPAAQEALAFVNMQAARGLVNLAEGEEDQMALFSLEYYRARDDAWGVAAVLPFVAGEEDLDRFRRAVLESIRMLRAIGDHQETAFQLNLLAEATHTGGYFAEAREYFKESIGLSRTLGDRYNVSLGLDRAGWVARQMGDYDTARREHEESLALSRDIGDQLGIAGSLDNLGLVAFEQGDEAEAGRLFREALVLRRATGHADSIVVSLEHLARLHIQRRELAEAERALDECLTLAADWPQIPYRLGSLRLAQGRHEEAQPLYQRALQISYEHSFLWLVIEIVTSLAELYARLGDAPRAVETLTCLLDHYACNHFTQRRARRLLEALTKTLTPHVYAEAEARGRALALGEVVKQAEALKEVQGREGPAQ